MAYGGGGGGGYSTQVIPGTEGFRSRAAAGEKLSPSDLDQWRRLEPQQTPSGKVEGPPVQAGPSPFTPYSTGGGLQPINQDKSMGLDMTKPGYGQEFWEKNQGAFDPSQQTQTESFWSQNQGQLSAPTQGETHAADLKAKYGTGPNVSTEANFGAYYDRAKERATESLDSSLAARGAYGSSVGLGQIGETIADLEADRARNEADFGLRARGEERAWVDSLAGVQHGAGNQGLDRFRTGMDSAGTADRSWLDKFRTGMDASGLAQGEKRQRGQDFFGNQMLIGDRMAGLSGDTTDKMLSEDQALIDSILSLGIGESAVGVSGAHRGESQAASDRARQDDQIRLLLESVKGLGG